MDMDTTVSGLAHEIWAMSQGPAAIDDAVTPIMAELVKFAESIVAVERERCARLCDAEAAYRTEREANPDYKESEAALRASLVDRLRNGPAPLDDLDLNDQAADYIEQHSDPLMDRINRSGPFADAP